MRTKYLSIVALLCGLVYAAALGFATYRIARMVTERSAVAKREFTELVDRASSAAVLGFMDEPFRETVRDDLRSSKALAAAVVTGPGGPEYAVERSPGYIVSLEGEPRFAQKFDTSRTPFFAPIQASSVRNATISATARIVDPEVLASILRDALLAVAAAAVVATLFLVVDILRSSGKGDEAKEEKPASLGERENAGSGGSRKSDKDELFDIEVPDLSEDLKAEIIEGGGQAERTARKPPVQEEAGAVEEPSSRPAGLYSPRGEIGWESYAADRLASEVHRCASFEQDLVLLMMEPKGADGKWEAVFPDFAESTVSFFTFRDLVFENGDQGLSVILPNVDLEHGLRMADEFRKKLRKSPVSELAAADIRIGLTARSGRLVDVERLMLEASRALSKAIEEKASPVVAFKPDPERYRSFIAARS